MKSKTILLIITILFLTAASAAAMGLGTNITIYDGSSTGAAWHGAQEDQEVEPGDTPGQLWDLEGFFLKGSQLTMVGGFDFVNGVGTYLSGDIFIDIDGDAQYGADLDTSGGGYATVADTFGYDYVLDLDFDAGSGYSYDVYALTGAAATTTVYYSQNEKSNPWRYAGGGTKLLGNVALAYYTGLLDSDVAGLQGGSHNALTVDIGFLAGEDFTAHFTVGCGNDNLMAKGRVPVPEPATVLLLGLGLLAMGILYGRKQGRQAA